MSSGCVLSCLPHLGRSEKRGQGDLDADLPRSHPSTCPSCIPRNIPAVVRTRAWLLPPTKLGVASHRASQSQ